ncbi:MAG TPA: SMC-Scp complex subunit ScpB, partial [Verrucomicrobiae bacterium]|nr:SMC-Scp complex subunit ScpB [Verrucomicrobiae bacterium]
YKPQFQGLSHAALETLAIIAYKQPVTRGEIELIRGVQADRAVATLLEKNLVKEVGRKEGPGRPVLFATTDQFLIHFGLKGLDDLPAPEDFVYQQDGEQDTGQYNDEVNDQLNERNNEPENTPG